MFGVAAAIAGWMFWHPSIRPSQLSAWKWMMLQGVIVFSFCPGLVNKTTSAYHTSLHAGNGERFGGNYPSRIKSPFMLICFECAQPNHAMKLSRMRPSSSLTIMARPRFAPGAGAKGERRFHGTAIS